MGLHKIKKGLDLPIAGDPEQQIDEAPPPTRVALMAEDYVGMKPTMHVAVDDTVRRGHLLFEDKKTPGVRYTSPGAGTVVAVNRGHRRALQSVVIQLDEADLSGRGEAVSFSSFTGDPPSALSREQIKELLVESSLWTAIRRRPFSKVPPPEETPHSIFVTAMDSNPLAPSVDVVLRGREEDFERGLKVISQLTGGPVFVCKAPNSSVRAPSDSQFREEIFEGPHPAGTAGVHIHMLAPVSRDRVVWWIGYQDVAAIGKLFATGELDLTRIISLAGPSVNRPRLLKTRIGASTDTLLEGELKEGRHRVISGSVLSGRTASGEIFGYLGRFHNQISVIREDPGRHFLGWLAPGWNTFSVVNAFASKLLPGRKFALTTTTYGSDRAMVPIGAYERVMPMDLMPTFLLRSLLVGDIEKAEELGCLELDEEDVALCSFVCPGKSDYGPLLRQVLDRIEKEG